MAAAAIAMLVRMKLSNEAATEITSVTGQGITTVVGFAEMKMPYWLVIMLPSRKAARHLDQ